MHQENGFSVVSPVQIYLDCMQLKGHGEETAGEQIIEACALEMR